ncbi:MAG TPA: phenylalanine--tRNA ligase subunit beta, partial [Longimicrobiales bacterium]|nr:phenylalanine--tRNA ligase subunit beta [Longimicrobiales bacterium]
MDISYRWLRDLVPALGLDLEEVERRLADRGAPVEGVERLGEGLEGVVAGRVEEVRPHPDADRLTVCRVDAGTGVVLPVVCGAPNVGQGRSYAFAPVGTLLPGVGEIRETEIRGQRSVGMLCSARELGLGTDHTGLLETPEGTSPGAPLVEVLGLDDHRLDVEVTANRGDLLSHVGIAREVAPGGVAGICLPDIPGAPDLSLRLMQGSDEARGGGATVRIEDADLCRRYIGVVMRGVTVGPSPAWLQSRLRAADARPINNVVDATNYVLLELGQPLHAFDLDRLEEHTVVVRRPRGGEEVFTTLDGEARRLGPDMLMICDARRPVAVAGVMGGLESEVGSRTTDVLLECALFDPASIRSTRRALGMSTDASYRFERGVDPAGMERAVRRAVEIILATAGGRCEVEAPDCDPRPWSRGEVRLRVPRV